MSDLRELIITEVKRRYADRKPDFETLAARRRRRKAIRATLAGVATIGAVVAILMVFGNPLSRPWEDDYAELGTYRGGQPIAQLQGRDCGRIERDLILDDDEPAVAEVQCILDAFRSGEAAYLITQFPTMEGGTHREIYQIVGPRRVDVFNDTTQDSQVPRGINRRTCRSLEPRETIFEPLLYEGCNRGSVLKLSKQGYRSCGQLHVDVSRRETAPGSEKVECLLDAFRSGRPRTLSVEFNTADEGSARAHYKVVGVRQVEIFYDSTDDYLGARNISERQCRSLARGEPVLTHGECEPPTDQ